MINQTPVELRPLYEKARIYAQIQSSYSNRERLTLDAIAAEPFQKAINTDKIAVYTPEVIEKFCREMVEKQKENQSVEKAQNDLLSLAPVKVIGHGRPVIFFYDAIDIEKGEYKLNAINALLKRSGKVASFEIRKSKQDNNLMKAQESASLLYDKLSGDNHTQRLSKIYSQLKSDYKLSDDDCNKIAASLKDREVSAK